MALKAEAQPLFLALTNDSSSGISPLTLPRGAAGYFDHMAIGASPAAQLVSAIHTSAHSQAARGSQAYSPLSPGVRNPAVQHQSLLSPHLWPVEQHQSSSLPPKIGNSMQLAGGVGSGLRPNHAPAVGGSPVTGSRPPADALVSPAGLTPASHPPSSSADSAMVQRLTQQNRRIREAWEAERRYLEANRERAEEVYKEERALMEEERAEWESEKTLLLQEIGRLQQQISALGRNVQAAPNGAFPSSTGPFSASPPLRGGGGSSTSSRSLTSSQSSQINPPAATQSLGPGVSKGNPSSAQPFPHSSSNMASSSSGTLGGTSNPSSDFLISRTASESESGRTRLVDVQDIDPKLEGIPIKITALTKPTFTDPPSHNESKESSSSVASPTSPDRLKITPGTKTETLQVLAANESDRLTLHAGHTPSHSLSVLPTGIATASSDDGSSTPTMPQRGSGPDQDPPTSTGTERDHRDIPEAPHPAGPAAAVTDGDNRAPDDDPEAPFDPADDRKLKGPLMVRNVPAHDEIFFQKLTDKLEEVSKDGDAALPAVLKAEHDDQPGSGKDQAQAGAGPIEPQMKGTGGGGGDETGSERDEGSSRSGGADGSDDDSDDAGTPIDVPLRFKRPMNFGAPLGEMPLPYRLATTRQVAESFT